MGKTIKAIIYKGILAFSIIIIILLASLSFTLALSASANEKVKSLQSQGFKVTPQTDGNIRIEIETYNTQLTSVETTKSDATTEATACYAFLGVKWLKTPIKYIINPTNNQGLSKRFITSRISKAAETWDNQTSKELFNNSFVISNILRPGIADSKNVIGFENMNNPNVIAVTVILVDADITQIEEFDQTYNTDFALGDGATNKSKYDLQNVLSHEFGHAIGLDHVSSPSCAEATMYPYLAPGEIKKRTLFGGDVKGLRTLYGI